MITIYHGIRELLTLDGVAKKDGRRILEADLGIIENAVLVVRGGKVLWTGTKPEFTRQVQKKVMGGVNGKAVHLRGADVIPAFCEAHTHLVFAGDRINEFEKRNQGMSYAEIAKAGGGIWSTVEATRKASVAELTQSAQNRVNRFIQQGVTCIEVKSGYGLDFKSEKKMLSIANGLKRARIVTTFLGPHAVPKEAPSSAEYLNEVIAWLPKLKSLTQRVDMFVEKSYFSLSEAEQYFEAAMTLGFQVVGHTDQLNHTGASARLAKMNALSVDHAIQLTAQDIEEIGASRTTVTLLPTSDFYTHLPYPPARKLIEAGARVAIATDINPGTAPCQDLSLTGVLARLHMKMTLPEVIAAYTYNAAAALGLSSEIGSLEPGKDADFVVLSDDWRKLFYEVGFHPVEATYQAGKMMKS